MLDTQREVFAKHLKVPMISPLRVTVDVISLSVGGGGRSAVQLVLGRDTVTAGGGGGGADCLKSRGCGGGGKDHMAGYRSIVHHRPDREYYSYQVAVGQSVKRQGTLLVEEEAQVIREEGVDSDLLQAVSHSSSSMHPRLHHARTTSVSAGGVAGYGYICNGTAGTAYQGRH